MVCHEDTEEEGWFLKMLQRKREGLSLSCRGRGIGCNESEEWRDWCAVKKERQTDCLS